MQLVYILFGLFMFFTLTIEIKHPFSSFTLLKKTLLTCHGLLWPSLLHLQHHDKLSALLQVQIGQNPDYGMTFKTLQI